MAANVETLIWLAMKGRIESLPLGFPFAWPSQTFYVPDNGTKPTPFIRVGRVSVAPQGVLVDYGTPHIRTGALILSLVAPIGADQSVYDQMAGTIADHFKDGTQMRSGNVCVTVRDAPHVQEGYLDNAYWTIPVRISWRCVA